MQCLMPLSFCLPGLHGQPGIGRQLFAIVHAYILLCIHTKLHGHVHRRWDWIVIVELLPMVKIRVPRPEDLRCLWLECICVCSHWRRGTFARGSQCTSRDRIFTCLSCWSVVTSDVKVLAQSGQWAVTSTSQTLVCSKLSTSVYTHGGEISHAFWKCRFVSL